MLVLFLLDYFLAFEVDSELLLGILIQGFQEMPEGMDCQVFPLRSLLEMSARNQRKQKVVLENVTLNYLNYEVSYLYCERRYRVHSTMHCFQWDFFVQVHGWSCGAILIKHT